VIGIGSLDAAGVNLLDHLIRRGQIGQGAYSNDLRSRVAAEVAAGTSRRQAARLYRVSASSAVRWAELHDETGSVGPKPRGGRSRSPLEPHTDWLLKLVAQEPDLTLREIEQRTWEGLGLVTTERSIRRFFERHGISFKKKRCAQPSRTDPTSPKRARSGKPTSSVLMQESSSSSMKPEPTPKWFGPVAAAAGAGG
jgi:transposase